MRATIFVTDDISMFEIDAMKTEDCYQFFYYKLKHSLHIKLSTICDKGIISCQLTIVNFV